jgi:hypothetical protein
LNELPQDGLVGLHLEVAIGTGGGSFPIGGIVGGQIFARTPELGSIALFRSGALGLAGFALARLRMARGARGAGRRES